MSIIGEKQPSSFEEQYLWMSDGELLKLASERGMLVADASVALDRELSKRKLDINEPYMAPALEQVHELPYAWGKFVGGTTVISALIGIVVYSIRFDWLEVACSILYGYYGFGIYQKKKWAVFILETGSFIGAIVLLLTFFKQGISESIIALVFLVVFWLPQTIYFWKRRDELR